MPLDRSNNINIQVDIEDYQIDIVKVRKLIFFILKEINLPLSSQVNLFIISPFSMKKANKDFRNIDKVTDVLSFPQQHWKSSLCIKKGEPDFSYLERVAEPIPSPIFCLGDVLLCPEKAYENSKNIGHDFDQEFCFLLVHAILHLCGHDHKFPKEEKLMLQQQQSFMSSLGSYSPPFWSGCIRRREKR